MNKYWVRIDGDTSGPFTAGAVRKLALDGKMPKTAEISRNATKWRPVDRLPGLTFGLPAGNETHEADSVVSGVGDEQPPQSGKTPVENEEPTTQLAAGQEFSVFLSYRRSDGAEVAQLLKEKLSQAGFRVFLDTEGMHSGEWNSQLKHRIAECSDFIPIITHQFFDRCSDEADPVRNELNSALTHKKNVIPFLVGQAEFPNDLPEAINKISSFQAVRYHRDQSGESVDKLRGMLTAVGHGLNRLGRTELAPKIVVSIVALVVTLTYYGGMGFYNVNGFGDFVGQLISYPAQLVESMVYQLVFLIPVLGACFGASFLYRTDPNVFYCGKEWVLFWIISVVALCVFNSLTGLMGSVIAYFVREHLGYALANAIIQIVKLLCLYQLMKAFFRNEWWKQILTLTPQTPIEARV